MSDKYDIKSARDFLRLHLQFAVKVVQEGKMGVPTLNDLQICGKLHAILEDDLCFDSAPDAGTS